MNDPQDWIGCKFSVADLHDKVVDYAFRDGGHLYAGEGRLIAVAKGDLMRVRIVCQMEMARDVRGGMIVVEKRRFENPCSSG